MKKQLKWLLIGSLMCLGLGSSFQASYGMFNDEIIEDIEFDNSSQYKECFWQGKAIKVGISDVELKKVENGFYTYEQIVNGYEHWNKFNLIKDMTNVANEKKLNRLINAAEDGCEEAIKYLLDAHLYDRFGLPKNNPKGLELAKKYADKGSDVAIRYLLSERYGLEPNNPEGLVLLKKYADKGSEVSIQNLIYAHLCGMYGLQANNQEALILVKEYARKGSEFAKDFLKH